MTVASVIATVLLLYIVYRIAHDLVKITRDVFK